MRILVVEDEAPIAAGIRAVLERDGHAVDVVSDGSDVLAWAGAYPYDLVILDIILPGIDGLELCGRLRSSGLAAPILQCGRRYMEHQMKIEWDGRVIVGVLGLVSLAGCATGVASPSTPVATVMSASPVPSVGASVETSPSNAVAASPSATPGPSGVTDPANFVAVVDNPWFPLNPGTTLTYRGLEDGEPAVDVLTVTHQTKVVDGVTCVVVDDNLKRSGVLAETTKDYYAQDRQGNVWYFGEDTAELNKHGKVTSREGSWLSGVDGALAGVFMEATPTVGKELQQEHYAGHAEDMFAVIKLNASMTVPYGSFKDVLETREWTPLEPDVLDHKFYARGVGEVREMTVKGGNDDLSLVSVTTH